MSLSSQDLAVIVAHAESFDERLASLGEPGAKNVRTTDAEARLHRWCSVAAKGDWNRFRMRLLWDHIDVNTALLALSPAKPRQRQDLPPWTDILLRVSAATADSQKEHKDDVAALLAQQPELPFQEVWLPATAVAKDLLYEASSFSGDTLLEEVSARAIDAMRYRLLKSLTELAGPVLLTEFRRLNPSHLMLLDTLLEVPTRPPLCKYNRFVDEVIADGLASVLRRYPVFAKLVAILIHDWVDDVGEFLARVQNDRCELEQTFLDQGVHLGRLTAVDDGLSDPHVGRRMVRVATFECGKSVVYKPRTLAVDGAFQQLLTWCNTQGLVQPLRVLKLLNRENYGWVEFVSQGPLMDNLGARRYYVRAGYLLCLAYLLGATDLHHENLIAATDQPVLIDLETLAYHDFNWAGLESTEAQLMHGDQRLWDSVLRSGLLPSWEVGEENEALGDVSGLGSSMSENKVRRTYVWSNLNTDWIHLNIRQEEAMPEKNEVMLYGKIVQASDWVGAIEDGFREMHRLLVRQKYLLSRDDGPLKSFHALPVRFVVRSTESYLRLLDHSVQPEFLRSGVERSIEIDRLSRNLTIGGAKPREWPILEAERRAIEAMDIPLFGASTDTPDLNIGLSSPLRRFFYMPSYQRIIERVHTLDNLDEQRQVAMIRGAFYASTAKSPSPAQYFDNRVADVTPEGNLSRQEFLEAAGQIAELLEKQSIPLPDGGVGWMSLDYAANLGRYQYQSVSASLYEGTCGIALFLVAYGSRTGERRFIDLGLSGLRPLRNLLRVKGRQGRDWAGSDISIGGLVGLGSIVYTFSTLAGLLGDSSLTEDAQRTANLITPAMIGADERLDVMTGAAGAALGLLSLHRLIGEGQSLDRAALCAEHLLHVRSPTVQGVRAWIAPGYSVPPIGFAHGSAGISYALSRVFAATGDRRYRDAAQEGQEYTRQTFLSEAFPSADLRHAVPLTEELSSSTSWCNGSSGIWLSHQLQRLPQEYAPGDSEGALLQISKATLQSIDHVCCGNFGRLEALLVTSQEQDNANLREIAEHAATSVVRRSVRDGGYHLVPGIDGQAPVPGFFRGLAGIGYGLLRVANPTSTPSIILLQ